MPRPVRRRVQSSVRNRLNTVRGGVLERATEPGDDFFFDVGDDGGVEAQKAQIGGSEGDWRPLMKRGLLLKHWSGRGAEKSGAAIDEAHLLSTPQGRCRRRA